jgi:hypothetical protein
MQEQALQRQILLIGLLVVIAAGLLAHAFFPRFEWRTVQSEQAVSVIVYDRWTGQFQRAVYNDSGSLNVMGPFKPF